MKSLVSVGSFGAKIAIVITATVGGTALVGSSVFASLTATANNASAHSVTSGTLKLTQTTAGNGLTAGFTTAVTALAPGDTISRFIDLSNGGTLAGASMTLGLFDSTPTPTKLTTDATNGLQVVVKECTIAYDSAGACTGGTETSVLLGTSAKALITANQALTLAAPDLVNGAVAHFKFAISLPASGEVTLNGSVPVGGIQGVAAALTWTITETQRNGIPTVA